VHGQVSLQALVKDHQLQAHMHGEALVPTATPAVPSLASKHAILVVAADVQQPLLALMQVLCSAWQL
jgi:hypothetical protein